MSLPEESVAANTLPEVTTIPTGKKLIFTDPDTNEGGIITLENLSKQILQNLTSQTFALDQGNLTLLQALNQLNSNVKNSDIKYIQCGGYGTLAAFSIGKLLYCKFNGTDKTSEVEQQDIAQLPSEYTLNSSIGVYRSVLVNTRNTGSLKISTDGKITLYCPRTYLYGQIIIPIK